MPKKPTFQEDFIITKSNKMIPRVLLFISLLVFVQAKNLRIRDDSNKCGSLVDCLLQNLNTGQEIPLTSSSSTTYQVYDSQHQYSIRCNVEGEINKISFRSSNDGLRELWNAPYWMNGINDVDSRAIAEPLLSNCGAKTISVVGEIWTGVCFEESFQLEADCGSKSTCDYQCPAYSAAKPSTCISSFDDCDCRYGYKKVGHYCVKEWCYHDFQCPEGMERVAGKDCYTSRRDCQWKPLVGR